MNILPADHFRESVRYLSTNYIVFSNGTRSCNRIALRTIAMRTQHRMSFKKRRWSLRLFTRLRRKSLRDKRLPQGMRNQQRLYVNVGVRFIQVRWSLSWHVRSFGRMPSAQPHTDMHLPSRFNGRSVLPMQRNSQRTTQTGPMSTVTVRTVQPV